MTETSAVRPIPLWLALLPLLFLIAMLASSVVLFGDNASYGPNQIALMVGAGVAGVIGLFLGFSVKDIEEAMVQGILLALKACLILLAVGSLIGSWMLAGTAPTVIYFGLNILDPSWFYPATLVICALVALSIGSSWTTAGTIGLALVGVAQIMDMSLPVTAGAVISGAYFGDKMSPLSDTTNLAPAVAGTDLFTHIRHMAWTTAPSFTLALVLFAALVVAACPFLLLVGAAPNAIAYDSGQFTTAQFFLAGIPASVVLMAVVAFAVAIVWPLIGMSVTR